MKKDLFKTVDPETKEILLQQSRIEGRMDVIMEEQLKIETELLKLNIKINDIKKATNLTKQEIETLHKQILGK